MKKPLCVIIAGPNGAGKTTFAADFLPKRRDIQRFINADLIAAGISPLNPPLAVIAAGRVFLQEMDRLAAARESFGFESTLSGLTYAARLSAWKQWGYRIEIVFLKLQSVELAKARVKNRVRHGGHDVPPRDIERRFERGWRNFNFVYVPLADEWTVFDNSNSPPILSGHFP